MPEIATDAELRGVAKAIETRGIPKALRALEATRKQRRSTYGGLYCKMCVAYKRRCAALKCARSCRRCPGYMYFNDCVNLCTRVLQHNVDATVAKLCTRLMRFIRAEQKKRG